MPYQQSQFAQNHHSQTQSTQHHPHQMTSGTVNNQQSSNVYHPSGASKPKPLHLTSQTSSVPYGENNGSSGGTSNYQPAISHQQLQQHTQNNFNNLRSNVIQPSRGPLGGGLTLAQQQQQQLQQKYYDQYENYARPNPSAQNYANNNHVMDNQRPENNGYYTQSIQPYVGNTSYNNHPQTQLHQQPNFNSQNTGNGYGGSGSIGKITDYDPLTDGPRHVPQPPRASQTLIYASDRGSGKTL